MTRAWLVATAIGAEDRLFTPEPTYGASTRTYWLGQTSIATVGAGMEDAGETHQLASGIWEPASARQFEQPDCDVAIMTAAEKIGSGRFQFFGVFVWHTHRMPEST